MEIQMQTHQTKPKFVRLHQDLIAWRPPGMDFNLGNMLELSIDIGMQHKIGIFEEMPKVLPNTGVYRVEDGGDLIYVGDDFEVDEDGWS